eukprot:1189934-Prorocentrum_minimum.AAC.5
MSSWKVRELSTENNIHNKDNEVRAYSKGLNLEGTHRNVIAVAGGYDQEKADAPVAEGHPSQAEDSARAAEPIA